MTDDNPLGDLKIGSPLYRLAARLTGRLWWWRYRWWHRRVLRHLVVPFRDTSWDEFDEECLTCGMWWFRRD